MLTRNEKGKLTLDSLELEIFFDDLFEMCDNQHELDWVLDQIQVCAELCHDESSEKFEEE